MTNKKIDIIYLMGTGRSGTTALATILNNHEDILTIGEVNQFYKEIESKIINSKFWGNVLRCSTIKNDLGKCDELIFSKERHSKALLYLLGIYSQDFDKYEKLQLNLFNAINTNSPDKIYLDSSKYVSRSLLLSRIPQFNIKVINLVRDPRGLVWSFKKKVQTSNSPIKTIAYYWLISLITILAKFKLRKTSPVLTIKYEDIINDTKGTFRKISNHTGLNLNPLSQLILDETPFMVPDIIGGNRIKSRREIIIKEDNAWSKEMPRIQQIIFYLLTLPLNIKYGYRL